MEHNAKTGTEYYKCIVCFGLNLTNRMLFRMKYFQVYFNIAVKRHSAFWVHLIIIPCFILGFLIIAGLVLNTDSTTIESVVSSFFVFVSFFKNPILCEHWPSVNCVNRGGNINDDR